MKIEQGQFYRSKSLCGSSIKYIFRVYDDCVAFAEFIAMDDNKSDKLDYEDVRVTYVKNKSSITSWGKLIPDSEVNQKAIEWLNEYKKYYENAFSMFENDKSNFASYMVAIGHVFAGYDFRKSIWPQN